jgi:hypothetical protein
MQACTIFARYFFRQQTTEISKLLWMSSFNCIYVVRVLLYGANKTGNPLPV